MGLQEKLAEALARRIKPKDLVERIGVSIEQETAKQIKSAYGDKIGQIVREHLESMDLASDLRNVYTETLREAIKELFPQYMPVLVLEEGFEEYAQMHELVGPIGTVNVSVDERGEVGYIKLLDEIKERARENGGNVIEVTSLK